MSFDIVSDLGIRASNFATFRYKIFPKFKAECCRAF